MVEECFVREWTRRLKNELAHLSTISIMEIPTIFTFDSTARSIHVPENTRRLSEIICRSGYRGFFDCFFEWWEDATEQVRFNPPSCHSEWIINGESESRLPSDDNGPSYNALACRGPLDGFLTPAFWDRSGTLFLGSGFDLENKWAYLSDGITCYGDDGSELMIDVAGISRLAIQHASDLYWPRITECLDPHLVECLKTLVYALLFPL